MKASHIFPPMTGDGTSKPIVLQASVTAYGVDLTPLRGHVAVTTGLDWFNNNLQALVYDSGNTARREAPVVRLKFDKQGQVIEIVVRGDLKTKIRIE